MGKPWEDYKEEIHDLYIKQNLPLKEVQEILKNKWGFDACKRAFQNQIEAWGFRKNVRSAEMQVYVQQKKLRKSDSEIDLPDETKKIITPRKARRFEKRSETVVHHKSTSLELDPGSAAASALGVPHHHHHHHHHHNQQGLHSPSYSQHRMSMGGAQGYSNFTQYQQDTMGYSPTFPPSSNASGHEMPKYAHGMTISLCDDANSGSFSLPVSKSPYDSAAYINPAMTTSASFAPPMSTEAPLYDLTDEFSLQNGMQHLPSGIVKKNAGGDWYTSGDDLQAPYPTPFNFTCSENQDSELLTLCFSGAVKDIRMMLDKGANANVVSVEGETPLTCVVKGMLHSLQATSYPVEYLVRYLNNYNKVLDLLLRSGADPNQPNRNQEYPLQLAYSAKDSLNSPYVHEEVRKQLNFFLRQLNSGITQHRGYSYFS